MSTTYRTDIIRKGSAEELCAKRDRALELIERGLKLISEGSAVYQDAASDKNGISGAVRSHTILHLLDDGRTDQIMDGFRRHVDAGVWRHMLAALGFKNVMDRKALEEFNKQLNADPPAVTPDTLRATFQGFAADSDRLFKRGLVELFRNLDSKRYRTNKPFRIGDKVIITGAFSQFGGWNHYGHAADTIRDLDRILHVIDGKPPKDHRGDAAAEMGRGHYSRCPEVDTEYLHARIFKNGNVHLRIKRPDLVTACNRIIAEHYGAVLADDSRRAAA